MIEEPESREPVQLRSEPGHAHEDQPAAQTSHDPLNSAPAEDVESQPDADPPVWLLARDGDPWELMKEHWPKAQQGDGDSQLIVYTMMERCVIYRRRFKDKHLGEVQAEFSAHNDPELFMLNAEIWERCEEIYESWDTFDGWREMLILAARNGQPIAMVQIGGNITSNPETFDEGVRMIESALQTQNTGAVAAMAGVYAQRFMDRSAIDSWLLAACRMGFPCMVSIEGCERTQCGEESLEEFMLNDLGDAEFFVTSQRADEIYEAIASGNVQDLNIAGDLRRD